MPKPAENLIPYALGVLLLIVAINAFAGGYYGLSGAKNIPVEWLKDSPFHDYFIPSLFLVIVVGGSSLIAGIAVLKKHRMAYKAAFSCSFIILIWLAAQITLIGYVSWMQPVTGFAAIIILLLTRQLPKYIP